MNRQPLLEGKFLKLRPILQTDYPGLFAAASDPLIWEQHPFGIVTKKNLRSQKAMEKISGVLINKIQKTLEDGEIFFNYVYRIRREDYLKNPL